MSARKPLSRSKEGVYVLFHSGRRAVNVRAHPRNQKPANNLNSNNSLSLRFGQGIAFSPASPSEFGRRVLICTQLPGGQPLLFSLSRPSRICAVAAFRTGWWCHFWLRGSRFLA